MHAPERLMRRRGVVRGWLFVGLLTLSSGCGPRWTELHQPDSGIVVSLPGPATCGSVRDESSRGLLDGRFCSVALIGSRHDLGGTFSVQWVALPAGLDESGVAGLTRELAQQGMPDGIALQARPAELDGVPGVEYETTYSHSDTSAGSRKWDWTVRYRFAVRKGRLYELRAIGGGNRRNDEAWSRMLESFKFVPGEASR